MPTVSFNDTTICFGTNTNLVASSNISGGTYLWSNSQTTQSTNVSPSINSAYQVTYTLNGCSTSFQDSVYVNQVPTILITNNPTICYGSSTVLGTTVSQAGGTYQWSGYGLSGNNNQSQINVSPQNGNSTINEQFTYTVIYELNNCYDTSSTNVSVNLIPTITAFALQDTICPGQDTQLFAQGIPASQFGLSGTYSWNPCVNLIPCAGSTVTASPMSNTTFNVEYTFNGCTSIPASIPITVQAAPALSIQNNPNIAICEGGCVTLTALQNASAIVPTGYIWSTGETTQSITVCPTDTANYSVIGLTGTCQSAPANTVVNVTLDPFVSTQIILDTTICVGGNYTFNVATTGGVGVPSYQWYENSNTTNFGGIAIPNATNSAYTTPTFNSQGANYYYCTISYPGGVGCDALASSAGALFVLPDPEVSISSVSNHTLCIGGVADCIDANTTGGIGSNTYLWIPGGAVTQTFCPPSNVIGTIDYSVIVQQSGIACGSLPSNQVSISVVSDPTITISGLSSVCEGAEVLLTTAIQGGIGSVFEYAWFESNPAGQPYQTINGATSLNYLSPILTSDASYAVEMTLTGNGCNATDTFDISVFKDPQISIEGELMACMNTQIDLSSLVTGGTPNSTNLYTWYSATNGDISNVNLMQGPSILNNYSFTIFNDTSIFVIVSNSGYNCDSDTSSFINIDGIEWAEASFDVTPPALTQSIINPSFNFVNTSQNATNYFWNLGECDPQLPSSELFLTPTAIYNPTAINQMNYIYGCQPGQYQVMLIALNLGICPDTAYQVIGIQDEALVYVPNTFTPDEIDANNTYFFPVISNTILPKTYMFRIYNRWGEEIFSTSDVNEKWDGKYKDMKCQDGTYTWTLRFVLASTGSAYDKAGHVNLLRW